MKKLLYILAVAVLVSFTACSSPITTEKIEIVENNVWVTKPTKSDTTISLVESEESNYEFITTITQNELAELIPDEFPKYDCTNMINLDDGILYICTEKGFGNNQCSQDVFAYNMKNSTITHVADIGKLNSWLMTVYEVNGNYYFYTKDSSSQRLILCADGELTVLTDDLYWPIETEKGIAFTQTSTMSIVEFEGKKQTVFTPKTFPSIIEKMDPLRYISIISGDGFLFNIEDNAVTSILELPSYIVVSFDDFFWVEYDSEDNEETDILAVYNYDNEEMISFEGPGSSAVSGNGVDTVFRVDFDDNIWIYKYDKENNTMTQSILEDTKLRTAYFLTDNNYFIRVYRISYETNEYAYDIYRVK